MVAVTCPLPWKTRRRLQGSALGLGEELLAVEAIFAAGDDQGGRGDQVGEVGEVEVVLGFDRGCHVGGVGVRLEDLRGGEPGRPGCGVPAAAGWHDAASMTADAWRLAPFRRRAATRRWSTRPSGPAGKAVLASTSFRRQGDPPPAAARCCRRSRCRSSWADGLVVEALAQRVGVLAGDVGDGHAAREVRPAVEEVDSPDAGERLRRRSVQLVALMSDGSTPVSGARPPEERERRPAAGREIRQPAPSSPRSTSPPGSLAESGPRVEGGERYAGRVTCEAHGFLLGTARARGAANLSTPTPTRSRR